MKKILFTTSVALFLFSSSYGQSTEDSVKAVINKLFKAMKNSKGDDLLECFGDSAVLQTIVTTKEGKTMVVNEEITGFAKQISSLEEGAADERITFSGVKIDDNLAVAWTPYRFYYKKNFIHCGVNCFNLVRFNGKWKIQYLIDTRRKDGCL